MWLSHELLMEMEVVTLYCFVCGSSMQTGAVDASEVRFLTNVEDGTFVTSPSVHIVTLGSPSG